MNDLARLSRRDASESPTARRIRPRTAGGARLSSRLRRVARDTILDAAESVFARHGTAGGRMEQVAARAGVSVGTLYNHFRDRRALLAALIADRRARLLATVDAAVADAPGGFHERLLAFATALFEHVDTHRGLTVVLLREGRLGSASPGAPSADELQRRVTALVRDGQRASALRRGDADALAEAFLALVRARMTMELSGSTRAVHGASARWVTQFFLQGAERR